MELQLSDRSHGLHKDSIISQSTVQPTLLKKPSKSQSRFDGLSTIDIWAYGMGHFINDMTATCWFNYLLFFLSEVVHTDAGPYAILAGQLADGIATPIVGALSDRTQTRIGQRKPWYIAGCLLVICAFLPTFQDYSHYSSNKVGQTVYYIMFPMLFNIGWASVQISHMSLVPSLTYSRIRRDKLNNLRNSFTFVANLVVLVLGAIVFSTMEDKALEIGVISYVVVVVGVLTSVFFVWRIDEVKLVRIAKERAKGLKEELEGKRIEIEMEKQEDERDKQIDGDSLDVSNQNKSPTPISKLKQLTSNLSITKWRHWFLHPPFYLFGLCYTGVRLYTNVFGTLLPFYLLSVLRLSTQSSSTIPFTLALIQLLIYLSSVSTSLLLTRLYSRLGRKNTLLLGGLLCLISSTTLLFLSNNFSWPIYLISIIIGMAQSMTLSTGINLISEVIGTRGEKGAIVFGMYSFLDKVVSGVVIFGVTSSAAWREKEEGFVRIMTVVVPAMSCLLACAAVYFASVKEYNRQKEEQKIKNGEKGQIDMIEEELVM